MDQCGEVWNVPQDHQVKHQPSDGHGEVPRHSRSGREQAEWNYTDWEGFQGHDRGDN